jgi:hypothetical protein
MDNIQNVLKKNNLKLKIKNLSDLQSPNLTFRGFPTLKINSIKKPNLSGKYHLNKSVKRNSISSNDKNNKIEKFNNEKLNSENQILRKKIELLEEENKRLKEENKELKIKKEEELFNSSIKNDTLQNSKEKTIKFKTINSHPIKFNSSLITTASRYFINIRKATLLNDFTNSLPNEHAYTISNNVDSPKISNNNSKLIKLSTYSISHGNQNSNLINSLDSGFDMKLHLNNIKKRIKLLFDKYSKIIE